ncbi:MAG TPA: rRNA maturation RNase YbeY [Solibacterales bacterium]|nr:rRNA maturation RNase YbeY [Bryobacterales bacterium]
MDSGEQPPLVIYRRAPRDLRRAAVAAFARTVRQQVSGAPYTCLISDDAELRRLNREFLGKDYATDVLSFPEPGSGSLGEIAISADRARAQAAEYGHPVETEICILLLHGVLHLMGMDHERDRGKMALAERRWREKLGLPGGLIERAGA